jgi:hypothetical protein
MIENCNFELNEEQLTELNAWVRSAVTPLHQEGCSESIEVVVQFGFSILGRSVEVSLSDSNARLIIEDPI